MAGKDSDSFGWILFPFALVWEWRKRMGLVGPATVLVVLALLSYGFHQYTAPRLANWPEYELSADRWEITQKPNWIRRDVARDAIEKSDLTHASLLDPQLAEKTSQAFLLCSWVKEVNRVEKRYPANVRVDLTYRKPVAMVEVIDQEAEKEGMACFPVDDAGVLLPTSDFSQTDLAHYPRIRVDGASLQAPAGAVWGDSRVEQAAVLAGAIIEHYKQWGVERIELVSSQADDRRAKGPFLFRLIAARGLIIDFGHAPGMESSEEATASQKIRWLNDYRTKNGSFDTLDPGYIIDLRDASGPKQKPTIGG
jgi:hypothetical protein